jgi:molecular chaperone GrpE
MQKDHDVESAPQESTGPLDIEADVPEEISEVDQLAQDLAHMKDQLLRTLAEAENVRKRSAKDLEESAKYAVTGFAREMLGVSDNLQRALASVDSDQLEGNEALATFVEGVQLTAQSLESVLIKFHVSVINPTGELFSPAWHQAMLEVPHETIKPGHVVDVLQVGYRIHDRLLRPALVSVAK